MWKLQTVLHYHFNLSIVTEYHNTDGPWWIEKNVLSSLGETIVQATEELGYTRLDVNGASNEGLFIFVQIFIMTLIIKHHIKFVYMSLWKCLYLRKPYLSFYNNE